MAVINFLLRTLLNLLVLVLVLALCLVGLLVWSAPKFGPKVIDWWVEGKTGYSVTIEKLDLKLFSGSANVEGIVLMNPPYYQNKNFLQIREISVQVEPRSFYKERIVFDHVFVDLDKFIWEKNAQGSINVVEFFDKFKKEKGASLVKKAIAGEGIDQGVRGGHRDYIIKKLVIKIGEIDVIGFPLENDTQSFVLNYNKEFTDVNNMEAVVDQMVEDLKVKGVMRLMQDSLNSGLASKLKNKVDEKIQKNIEKVFRFLKKASK